MRKLYEIVGLGGTFDHFHIGHEHFIKFASQFGQHLHIGITHPKLTQHKTYAEQIESFETRKKAVKKFCLKEQISAATSQLTDIYGPTVSPNSKITGLIVTEDTGIGADKINQTRQAMDLTTLPVHVCPLIRDERGQIISSDRIRSGKINRRGQIYATAFDNDLTLDKDQRQFLSQPQGELVDQPNHHQPPLICVVGDTSLEKFITNHWKYDLGIYDCKRQREHTTSYLLDSLKPDLKTINPPGSISHQLIKSLQQSLKKNVKHLFVDGEEDLATVALALLAPLNTVIYYGQPNQGLVKMIADETTKDNIFYTLTN